MSGEQVNGFGQLASRGFAAIARCPAVLGANVGRAGTRLESTGVRYPSGCQVITLGTYLLANPSALVGGHRMLSSRLA
jgi:hypothetical protein